MDGSWTAHELPLWIPSVNLFYSNITENSWIDFSILHYNTSKLLFVYKVWKTIKIKFFDNWWFINKFSLREEKGVVDWIKCNPSKMRIDRHTSHLIIFAEAKHPCLYGDASARYPSFYKQMKIININFHPVTVKSKWFGPLFLATPKHRSNQ